MIKHTCRPRTQPTIPAVFCPRARVIIRHQRETLQGTDGTCVVVFGVATLLWDHLVECKGGCEVDERAMAQAKEWIDVVDGEAVGEREWGSGDWLQEIKGKVD